MMKRCNNLTCYCDYKEFGSSTLGCRYSGYCDYQCPRDSREKLKASGNTQSVETPTPELMSWEHDTMSSTSYTLADKPKVDGNHRSDAQKEPSQPPLD
jgi:hypothetical protein